MTEAEIRLPRKIVPVFTPPRGSLRYRGAYGGRGSAKSFSFALMAAVWGYAEPLRILCTRELQNSIKESFHAEVKNAIESTPWLAAAYDVGVDYIKGKNGTEFIFRGLRHNATSIKSMAQIDLCIVEEAEDVPEYSWQMLEPTIRAPKSEIWVVWNPGKDGSPTDKRFRKDCPPRSKIVEINHSDNPFFPAELDEQRRHQQRTLDPATYAHIWEGAYLQHSVAQIFRGKYRIEEFEPSRKWSGPYYGLDFGFSADPTAGVKLWINDRRLYVEHEAVKVGLELDHTAPFLIERLPGIEKHAVRADCARPESISYLKRHGLRMIEGVKKWQGSVEDGIEHLKSYDEIIIHPRCEKVAHEFLNYSYKVDKLTGDVLPIVVDQDNHTIDAIRYGVQPLIRGGMNYSALVAS